MMWIFFQILLTTVGSIVVEFLRRRKSDAKNVISVGKDEWVEMKASMDRLKRKLKRRK